MRPKSRIVKSFAVSVALWVTGTSSIYAIEPSTIAAGAALGSAIISATSKPSQVQMAFAKAQLDITIAVHDRLDKVEAGIANIIISINQLPERVRNIIKEELENEKAVDVQSRISSIQQRVAEVEHKGLSPARDHALIEHYEALRTDRNNLFRRSDMVIPTIIQAFAAELSLARSMNRGRFAISEVKKQYRERLDRSVYPNEPGSLLWTLNILINEQRADEAELSKRVTGAEKPFSNELVRWITHSQYRVEQQTESYLCWQYEFDPTAMVRTKYLDYCQREVPVDVSVDNTVFNRRTIIYPSPLDGSLYRLNVSLQSPERQATGIIAYPERKHTEKNDAYEKYFIERHKELLQQISIFNKRVEAIEQILLTIRMVNLTISTIDQGVEAKEEYLQKEISGWTKRLGSGLQEIDRLSREASASWLVYEMDAERIKARKKNSDSLQRIQDAVNKDKKGAWRHLAISIFNIISASAQFAEALEAEVAAARLEAAAELARNIPDADQNIPEQTSRKSDGIAGDGIDVGGGKNIPEAALEKPISEMNSLERINFVLKLKDELQTMPLNRDQTEIDYERLRLQLTALVVLDSMSPSVGDKYFQENYKTTAELIGEIIAEGAGGDLAKTLASALSASLRPDIVSEGSLTSVSTQIALREYITADLANQLAIITKMPDLSTYVNVTYQNALSCKHGCYRQKP